MSSTHTTHQGGPHSRFLTKLRKSNGPPIPSQCSDIALLCPPPAGSPTLLPDNPACPAILAHHQQEIPSAWSRKSDPRAPPANISQDVPPEHLAYGNPARVIRRLVEDTAESENVQDQQISPVRLSPDSDASAAAKGDPTKTTTPTTPPPSACSSCSCPSASAPMLLSSPPSYLSSRYPVLTAQSGLLQVLFLLIGLALIFRYFA